MRRFVVSLFALVLVGVACSGGDDESASVTASEGHVVLGASSDGAIKVEAPIGSSASDVEVTIETLDPATVDDTLFEDTEILAAYDFGPDGTQFDEPVIASTTLSAADLGLADGQIPALVVGLGQEGSLEQIVYSLKRDGDALRITAEVEHFSVFVVGAVNGAYEIGFGPDTLELTTGETGEVTVRVEALGTPPSLSLTVVGLGPISVTGGGPVVFGEISLFTATCTSEGTGAVDIAGQAATHSGSYPLLARIPVTCLPQPTTTTSSTTTTTTLPPPEEVDTDFPVFDIQDGGDGTLILVGFGGVATFDPNQPAGADNPSAVGLPGAPVECVTEGEAENAQTDDDTTNDGLSANVSTGDSCLPELLGFDTQMECYWVLLPHELNCYDEDGEEVIGTSGDDTVCPPSGPGQFDGRNEKSTNAGDDAGAPCDPQEPIYIGASVNLGTDETPDLVEVPFFRPGGRSLGYVQPTDDGHEYVECLDGDKVQAPFSFTNDDITYNAGFITITGLGRIIDGGTKQYPFRVSVSWPDCEFQTSEELDLIDVVAHGPEPRIVGGIAYTVKDDVYGDETVAFVSPDGSTITIEFPGPVAFDQFSPVYESTGKWYVYAPGLNVCCDESGQPFEEPGPDFDNGAVYQFDPSTGEAVALENDIGRVADFAVVDGVLWAAQNFPDALVPIPLG